MQINTSHIHPVMAGFVAKAPAMHKPAARVERELAASTYNTGKVVIGRQYSVPARPHFLNADELRTQSALIARGVPMIGRRRLSDHLMRAAAVVLLAASALVRWL